MVDSIRYDDWISKAERDLKSAKVLKENECGNDMVAFHCQQAVEKLLKGFLLKQKGLVVEGHSLIHLCKLCSSYEPDFKKYFKDCGFINQYYIETRYPADISMIVSDDEADESIETAEKIYNLVKEKI